MLDILTVVACGLGIGHAVRRLTPMLINWKEKVLPFSLPWPEVLLALVFWLIYLEFGLAASSLPWYLMATCLLGIATCDAFSKYIPMPVIYVGSPLGVVLSGVFFSSISGFAGQLHWLSFIGMEGRPGFATGLALSLMGVAVGFLCLEIIRRLFGAIATTEVMGAGDAYILMMIGAFIGPKLALFTLFPACIFGMVGGGLTKLFKSQPHAPFGPSLAAGAMVMLLYHQQFLAGIDHFQFFLANLSVAALMGFMFFLLVVLILLMLRLRRKAAEYERQIEEDYAKTDEKMK